jgi:hypothetical protein
MKLDFDLDAPTDIAAEHRSVQPMEPHSQRVCAVSGCVALADRNGNQCPVHRNTRRLDYVMSGSKCPRCGRDFEKGEWVTRESTLESMTRCARRNGPRWVGRSLAASPYSTRCNKSEGLIDRRGSRRSSGIANAATVSADGPGERVGLAARQAQIESVAVPRGSRDGSRRRGDG